jgi:hypothetical protein
MRVENGNETVQSLKKGTFLTFEIFEEIFVRFCCASFVAIASSENIFVDFVFFRTTNFVQKFDERAFSALSFADNEECDVLWTAKRTWTNHGRHRRRRPFSNRIAVCHVSKKKGQKLKKRTRCVWLSHGEISKRRQKRKKRQKYARTSSRGPVGVSGALRAFPSFSAVQLSGLD